MKKDDLKPGMVVEFAPWKHASDKAIVVGVREKPSRRRGGRPTWVVDLAVEYTNTDWFETRKEAEAEAADMADAAGINQYTVACVPRTTPRPGFVAKERNWRYQFTGWHPYASIPLAQIKGLWADVEARQAAADAAEAEARAERAAQRARRDIVISKRNEYKGIADARRERVRSDAAEKARTLMSMFQRWDVKIEVTLAGRPAQAGDYVRFKVAEDGERFGERYEWGRIIGSFIDFFVIDSASADETEQVARDDVLPVIIEPRFSITHLDYDRLCSLLARIGQPA